MDGWEPGEYERSLELAAERGIVEADGEQLTPGFEALLNSGLRAGRSPAMAVGAAVTQFMPGSDAGERGTAMSHVMVILYHRDPGMFRSVMEEVGKGGRRGSGRP